MKYPIFHVSLSKMVTTFVIIQACIDHVRYEELNIICCNCKELERRKKYRIKEKERERIHNCLRQSYSKIETKNILLLY